MIDFFGHAGHDHTAVAPGTVPWWQDELTVSIALLLGLFAALTLMHFVFKAKFGLKMVVAMTYLLVVGVLCYTVAPILSITALTAGMIMALTTTMLQLAHKNKK